MEFGVTKNILLKLNANWNYLLKVSTTKKITLLSQVKAGTPKIL